MVVPISWSDWIKLDPLARRAMELEAEDIASKRQQEQSKMQREIDMRRAEASSKLSYMQSTTGSLDRILKG